MIHNIRYRRLLKRALVICRESIEERSRDRLRDVFKFARRGVERHNELRRMALKIWKKAGKPCSRHEIWLVVPSPPSGKEGDLAFVRYPSAESETGFELSPLSESFPVKTWADQYWQHKYRAHVFCPAECVNAVAGIAKGVLEHRLDVKLNALSHLLCHVDETALGQM